jgi:hypothetical protein
MPPHEGLSPYLLLLIIIFKLSDIKDVEGTAVIVCQAQFHPHTGDIMLAPAILLLLCVSSAIPKRKS